MLRERLKLLDLAIDQLQFISKGTGERIEAVRKRSAHISAARSYDHDLSCSSFRSFGVQPAGY
jgi:hypothetical protein